MTKKSKRTKRRIRWIYSFLFMAHFGIGSFSPQKSSAAPVKQISTEIPVTTEQHILETHSKLPLSFEANYGQSDPGVKFLARGKGYTLFLTPSEAILALRQVRNGAEGKAKPHNEAIHSDHEHHKPVERIEEIKQTVVRMKLLEAKSDPAVTGREELPGKLNYIIGDDPTKWYTNIPTYARVQYTDVYPDVDLIYYGNHGQLEYDVVVKPGGDPSRVRLAIEGIESLNITDVGDLEIGLIDIGKIIQKRPYAYQEINGNQVEVAAAFKILDSEIEQQDSRLKTGTYGFEVASYDRNYPLIIDPTLIYSTFLGGGDHEVLSAIGSGPFGPALNIAVDSSGFAYVGGTTFSGDFPIFPGSPGSPGSTPGNCFVTKLTPDGSSLVYSTIIGGSGYDDCHAIAIDSAGSAYMTGSTLSGDFPTTITSAGTFAAYDTTYGGGGFFDAFVFKLGSTGSSLIYSTYLGGSAFDFGHGIAVDTSGNIYVTGATAPFICPIPPICTSDFPVTAGAYQTTIMSIVGPPLQDAYMAVLDPTVGGAPSLLYSTFLGGTGVDTGLGIDVDASGDVYLTGDTISVDFDIPGLLAGTAFDTSCGTDGTCNGGFSDAFVAKLSPDGAGLSDLLYSTYVGGSAGDMGIGLVEFAGKAYVAGRTFSSDFPTTFGAFDTIFGGGGLEDEIVLIVDPSAPSSPASLVYSTFLGGSGDDDGHNIAVDSAGNIYTNGGTTSTDFPTTSGALDASCGTDGLCDGGLYDAYVTVLSPAGGGTSDLLYSTYLGGVDQDVGHGIDVDSAGNTYVTGFTVSPAPFPMIRHADQLVRASVMEAFLMSLLQRSPPTAIATGFLTIWTIVRPRTIPYRRTKTVTGWEMPVTTVGKKPTPLKIPDQRTTSWATSVKATTSSRGQPSPQDPFPPALLCM
jgi:hypothetical protein